MFPNAQPQTLVETGNESLEKYVLAFKKYVNIVSRTYGPHGRKMYILPSGSDPENPPKLTNDGVSVLKSIPADNDYEAIAKKTLFDAAFMVDMLVGDGTTQSVILAGNLIIKCLQDVMEGKSNIEIKATLLKEKEEVLKSLAFHRQEATTKEELERVAYISSRDKEEAGKIADLVLEIGKEGMPMINMGGLNDTKYDVIDGFVLDTGFISPHFVDKEETVTTTIENPLVLLTNQKIKHSKDLEPLYMLMANQQRNIVVICNSIEGSAMETFKRSFTEWSQNEGMKTVYFIQNPKIVDPALETVNLKDYSACLSAKVFDYKEKMSVRSVQLDDLGEADEVVVGRKQTQFIRPKYNDEMISDKLKSIAALQKQATTENELNMLAERRAVLAGKIGTVSVGAETVTERLDKFELIKDALYSTYYSQKFGCVPGGGSVLYSIISELPEAEYIEFLKRPIQTLTTNSNLELVPAVSVKDNQYYDFRKNEMVETPEVLDSYKAVEEAVKRAYSLALTFVDIDGIIVS